MRGMFGILVNEYTYKCKIRDKVIQIYDVLTFTKDKQQSPKKHLSKKELKKHFMKITIAQGIY